MKLLSVLIVSCIALSVSAETETPPRVDVEKTALVKSAFKSGEAQSTVLSFSVHPKDDIKLSSVMCRPSFSSHKNQIVSKLYLVDEKDKVLASVEVPEGEPARNLNDAVIFKGFDCEIPRGVKRFFSIKADFRTPEVRRVVQIELKPNGVRVETQTGDSYFGPQHSIVQVSVVTP